MIDIEPAEGFLGGGECGRVPGHTKGGENGRWYAGTDAVGSGRAMPSGVGGVLAGCSSDIEMCASDSVSCPWSVSKGAGDRSAYELPYVQSLSVGLTRGETGCVEEERVAFSRS